ncbi:MAG: CotH kinase family protein [Bacteroidales bacterium]|nr:CotH kinase family protein [Bacteroidales bacterium]
MNRFLRIAFLSAIGLIVLAACGREDIDPDPTLVEPTEVPVTGVSLNCKQKTLEIGESFRLLATVAPSDADNPKVNWFSSEPQVASVEANGQVTALSGGTAVITVKTVDGGHVAECVITVPAPATDRWADSGATLNDYPDYNIKDVKTYNDFPRVDITLSGISASGIQHGEYTEGTISFKDPAKMYSDLTSYGPLAMKIKGRGNTSWNAEGGIKNAYRVKLAEHPANKIFSLNRDKDWILLADVQDPTTLRNAVAFRISRMVSMPWTPKFRAVELYINNQYCGCYLLVEAKETDIENKVPVSVSETGEADSGYYLEIDDKYDSDLYFTSSHFGKKIKYKDPESPSQAQRNFIEGYVNEVEKLLKNKKFDKQTGYWSKMEVETFINQYIVQELTMNVDGNMRLSTYFAKDKDTKLFMPMVWDFDLSLGNCTYIGNDFNLPYYDGKDLYPYSSQSNDGPLGWFVKIRGGYPTENWGQKDTYYQYLFQDPQFVAALKERWTTVKPRLDKIPAFINKMKEYNKVAYDHNAKAGKNPRGNRGYYNPPDNFRDWEEATEWLIKWYNARLEWLDTEIKAL